RVERVEHDDLEALCVADDDLDHAQQRAVTPLADELGVEAEAPGCPRAGAEPGQRHQPGTPGRVRRKVAPGRASVSSSVPPIRLANSEPIARPSPKPPSSLRPRPRWKRSKITSRSSSGTPGPTSATSIMGTPGAPP